jgi:alkylhydroperoxidase family enzyme
MQMLIALAHGVTLAPWELSRALLARAHDAGLTDDDVLHAVMLSAYFNHLNRIADAVAVPLDYEVRHRPEPIDRSVPARALAPRQLAGEAALDPQQRPDTWAALGAWQTYVMDRDAPLDRRRRTVIAAHVAHLVGQSAEVIPPNDVLDQLLVKLATALSTRPWSITDADFAPLRATCMDDATLFDACVTASTADTRARINVALRALAT